MTRIFVNDSENELSRDPRLSLRDALRDLLGLTDDRWRSPRPRLIQH